MKTIDTCGQQHYSPLIPAIKAMCEAGKGEKLEIIMDDAAAFNDMKEYLSEQQIGFREIYDGERMTLQFFNVQMKEYRLTDWLPTTKKEVELRGWDELDVILFSGDAYVDHPSFGAAVIGRILEAEGLRVAIIPQPNWRDDLRDFKKLGRPRLFFGISPGCMDSMVNKYTANKRLRSDDAYTPDARPDMRPEYPSIVYTQILKKLFPDVPVVLGGIEASMRRLTHYDYWQDRVRPSILLDSGADSLIYGMGEKPVVELAERLKRQQTQMDAPSFKKLIADIPQMVYLDKGSSGTRRGYHPLFPMKNV